MKVVVFADNTLPIDVPGLCNTLNRVCKSVRFAAGKTAIHFSDASISRKTFRRLTPASKAECKEYDLVLIGTHIPYENDYFFMSYDAVNIISFANWNLLTDLPIANGFLYFIASILADLIELGETHEENTGCLSDFWWDKEGVDFGMRAAYVCKTCNAMFQPKASWQMEVRSDITAILDLVSSASRSSQNALHAQLPTPVAPKQAFDVFLCHNSVDKPSVRKVNEAMKQAGLRTWFDEEQLSPGTVWQAELEKQIKAIKTAVVFVGASGYGPWQKVESNAFITKFVERECRVIPVILKGAPKVPKLPVTLKQFTWVDLRKNHRANLARLISSLNGR